MADGGRLAVPGWRDDEDEEDMLRHGREPADDACPGDPPLARHRRRVRAAAGRILMVHASPLRVVMPPHAQALGLGQDSQPLR